MHKLATFQKKIEAKKPFLNADFISPTLQKSDFIQVQSPDFTARHSGYLHGFTAGHEPQDKQEWLLDCAVPFARDVGANSASIEF
ncbi:MAG: peptidylprolyl isomerase [Gammaproteobacteria bacterium]